jgi:multisubunit Na+/H+ antiporter MnhC subunit
MYYGPYIVIILFCGLGLYLGVEVSWFKTTIFTILMSIAFFLGIVAFIAMGYLDFKEKYLHTK